MYRPPDASLVKNWLTGRSIARGLPVPVDDHGGWRVETGQLTEMRRYVFMEASAELHELASVTTNPQVVLKLCGTTSAMRAVLPPRWRVAEGGYFMTFTGTAKAGLAVPPGYECKVDKQGSLIAVRIVAQNGELAASGYDRRQVRFLPSDDSPLTTRRGHHQFTWARPRAGWLDAKCPVFFDFGGKCLWKLERYDERGLRSVRAVEKAHLIEQAMHALAAAEVGTSPPLPEARS